MRSLRWFAAGALLSAFVACSTTQKKDMTKTALDAMSPSERHDTIEASLRVFDERPELVDELYATTRRHPKTMHRFLENTARDLANEDLARPTAELLAANPPALEEMFTLSPDYIFDFPAARAAMDRAMASRAPKIVDILFDDPNALSRITAAILTSVQTKPRAKSALLASVKANRKAILSFVENDPELLRELAEPVLRELAKDKPVLDKALRAAKVIDDDDDQKRKRK